jgi:hypothetical protein
VTSATKIFPDHEQFSESETIEGFPRAIPEWEGRRTVSHLSPDFNQLTFAVSPPGLPVVLVLPTVLLDNFVQINRGCDV